MKRFKCIALCLLLVILFAACSPMKATNEKNLVTLTIWHTYVEQMGDKFATLVDEFNNTEGAAQNIRIEVAAVANATELNERLLDAANGVLGAPDLPDLAVLYPKVALTLANRGMLTDFDAYFSDEELARFMPEFLEEGRVDGKGLYLVPVAKSTEVLYVNRTVFDRFAAETGITLEQLATFEGITRAAEAYYIWTDEQTPDVLNDGKIFYYPHDSFNHALIGFAQQGSDFLDGYKMNTQSKEFERIWNNYYLPAIKGHVAIFDNFGNYLAMTGDVVCVTGTSAGAIFYPDSVTYADNTKEDTVFDVLPYPVYERGESIAIQRGGGICSLSSEPEKEYAASVFLKWFTDPDQNLRFAATAGYLPVTQEAFPQITEGSFLYTDNVMVQKALETTAKMQGEYRFFIPPVFDGYDLLSTTYNREVYALAQNDRARYIDLLSAELSPEEALAEISADAFVRLERALTP